MAAGIGLRETKLCSEEAFKAIWSKASDYILFECLDDKGEPQGCAVGKIDTQYRCDQDGGLLQLSYILVQDPYYEHWVEQQGGSKFHHHACRRGLAGCMRKVGRQNVVHIQRWSFITAEDVTACQREWKCRRLDEEVSGAGRGGRLVPMELHSKSKPAKPVRKDASPEPSPGDDGDDYDSNEEDHSPDKSKKERSEKKGRRKRRTVQDKSRRRRSEEEKTPRKKPPEGKDESARVKSSPLDAMLDDDDDEQPDYVKAGNRFEELRKSLEDRKRKRGDEASGASAVLARRVQAGAERGKEKKKKKRHKESKRQVTKALKALTRSKEESESGSSEDLSEDEDDESLLKGSKASDLTSRQRKLRRLSVEKPGMLLLKGFSLMHEQLGTLHGEVGGEGSAEDVLKPAALRYLLTTAFSQMNLQQVGEENLREMRTLASALDLLVGGKVSMAGDMMMQRLKSILMGIRDNSTAASRYLELIPMEIYPTASTLAESDFARSLALRNAKSEELMKKVTGPG